MNTDSGLMQRIFGSKVKTSIIGVLSRNDMPMTSNMIATEIGGGIGPVYSAIEVLVLYGLLKREGRVVSLDASFPYSDRIIDMYLTLDGHYHDVSVLLERIDRTFSDRYYISGYASVTARGALIDHSQDTMLIFIVGREKDVRKANLLFEVSNVQGHVRQANGIPKDVIREKMDGAEIWTASLERAISEGADTGELGLYPVALAIVQHVMDGDIDLNLLNELSEGGAASRIIRALTYVRPELIHTISPSRKNPDAPTLKVVKDALNTVLGGF
jgi:hypothetical protein